MGTNITFIWNKKGLQTEGDKRQGNVLEETQCVPQGGAGYWVLVNTGYYLGNLIGQPEVVKKPVIITMATDNKCIILKGFNSVI